MKTGVPGGKPPQSFLGYLAYTTPSSPGIPTFLASYGISVTLYWRNNSAWWRAQQASLNWSVAGVAILWLAQGTID